MRRFRRRSRCIYRPMFGSFGGATASTSVDLRFARFAQARASESASASARWRCKNCRDDRQARHGSQFGDAEDRGGSGDVRSARGRGIADLRAGADAAAGATIFSVLKGGRVHESISSGNCRAGGLRQDGVGGSAEQAAVAGGESRAWSPTTSTPRKTPSF